ncbi:aldo/keto reductase [Mammaliicoccus vitulinus]|uniref:aldo/keto reductase n=1 Tax=Mammaliicoccus vitulinus TaxID=71237 RepID=UPI00364571FB
MCSVKKPLESLIPKAHQQGVGIIARVPLASGLLTGKFTAKTTFAEDDHRKFNENGEDLTSVKHSQVSFSKRVELANQLEWVLWNLCNSCFLPWSEETFKPDL